MSRIQVTAEVYADEIMSELSCDDLADELLDRMTSSSLNQRTHAAKAIAKLGFAQPTPDDWTALLDDIEQAAAQGDRVHFGILMNRLRRGLDPTPAPAVLAAMTAAGARA